MLFLSPLSFLFQIQCSSFRYSLASYVQTLHLKIHCSTIWWKTAQCLVLKSLWMCDHHLCYIISCLHQKYVCNLHALFTADIRPGDQLSPSNQTDRWRGQSDWWTERWRENEQGEKKHSHRFKTIYLVTEYPDWLGHGQVTSNTHLIDAGAGSSCR